MRQPEGYEVENKEGLPMICKLKKGLYGLKQAAKLWNEKLHNADPCFYKRKFQDNVVYLIVHVDDFLVAAKNTKGIDEIAELLMKQIQLIGFGNSSWKRGQTQSRWFLLHKSVQIY